MTARLLTEQGVLEMSDERGEQCAALVLALDDYYQTMKKKRSGYSEARDRTVWRLHQRGCSDGAIADSLGITSQMVRNAIGRCKAGRYSWVGDA